MPIRKLGDTFNIYIYINIIHIHILYIYIYISIPVPNSVSKIWGAFMLDTNQKSRNLSPSTGFRCFVSKVHSHSFVGQRQRMEPPTRPCLVKTAGPQKSHRLDGRPRDSILAWLVFTKLDLFWSPKVTWVGNVLQLLIESLVTVPKITSYNSPSLITISHY